MTQQHDKNNKLTTISSSHHIVDLERQNRFKVQTDKP